MNIIFIIAVIPMILMFGGLIFDIFISPHSWIDSNAQIGGAIAVGWYLGFIVGCYLSDKDFKESRQKLIDKYESKLDEYRNQKAPR